MDRNTMNQCRLSRTLGLVVVIAFSVNGQAAEPINIGSRRELFVDEHLVGQFKGRRNCDCTIRFSPTFWAPATSRCWCGGSAPWSSCSPRACIWSPSTRALPSHSRSSSVWECGGLSNNVVASPVRSDGIVFVDISCETRRILAIKREDAKGNITGSSNVLWSRTWGLPMNRHFAAHRCGQVSTAPSGNPLAGECPDGSGTVGPVPIG